ncbi:MAG: GNAT family N-acetyltransferase [Blastocatellia bacterium AA13]|nr:MAG: GNAT family N-acetyltransferase [Blastocatellia bacterium AA13]
MTITLRPATRDDEGLLFELYRGSRESEIAAWGWDQAQQEAFLRMQFVARQGQYGFQFSGAQDSIILHDEQAIGRLFVMRGESEIRLVDIALLPAHQNSGIGTRLIEQLIEEGARSAKAITLHVEMTSPALKLYERLGFVPVSENGAHLFMRKNPDQST